MAVFDSALRHLSRNIAVSSSMTVTTVAASGLGVVAVTTDQALTRRDPDSSP